MRGCFPYDFLKAIFISQPSFAISSCYDVPGAFRRSQLLDAFRRPPCPPRNDSTRHHHPRTTYLSTRIIFALPHTTTNCPHIAQMQHAYRTLHRPSRRPWILGSVVHLINHLSSYICASLTGVPSHLLHLYFPFHHI